VAGIRTIDRVRAAARGGARVALWVGAGLLGLAALALVAGRLAAVARERDTREALAPRTGRLVATSDGAIHLQEAGPASGRVVVLFHGTGAWSEIWRPVMSALAAHGFRAVAVDLPPFGFSDRSPAADYGAETQARRVWAALDSLGVDSVILAGHSFGARATVAAALARPRRVERLVLIDAALGLFDTVAPPPPPSMAVRALLAPRPLRDALVSATVTNPMMTRTLMTPLVADIGAISDAQIEMLRRPATQRGSTRAASDWLPGFLFEAGPDVRAMRRSLAAFPRPTHIIWGALDDLTPVAQGEDLARVFACPTWDLLPGVGHIPGIENPEMLAAALVRRLQAPPRCR
jgi:pimeloyl-ACP methyl ester carboxylesterase